MESNDDFFAEFEDLEEENFFKELDNALLNGELDAEFTDATKEVCLQLFSLAHS